MAWRVCLDYAGKKKHPMRGRPAIVKDVLHGQQTRSGLRVVIQFTHFDPSSPFQTAVVDYDELVEAKYCIFRLID